MRYACDPYCEDTLGYGVYECCLGDELPSDILELCDKNTGEVVTLISEEVIPVIVEVCESIEFYANWLSIVSGKRLLDYAYKVGDDLSYLQEYLCGYAVDDLIFIVAGSE